MGVCGAQEVSYTLTEASGVDRNSFLRESAVFTLNQEYVGVNDRCIGRKLLLNHVL